MRITFLLLVFLSLSDCMSDQEVVNDYFEDGLYFRQQYYPNGELKVKGSFLPISDDSLLLHGRTTYFFDNGTPQLIEHFHRGSSVGSRMTFSNPGIVENYEWRGPNGELIYRENYVDGKIDSVAGQNNLNPIVVFNHDAPTYQVDVWSATPPSKHKRVKVVNVSNGEVLVEKSIETSDVTRVRINLPQAELKIIVQYYDVESGKLSVSTNRRVQVDFE